VTDLQRARLSKRSDTDQPPRLPQRLRGLAQSSAVLLGSFEALPTPGYSLTWLPEEFIFAHLATPEQRFGVSLVDLQGLHPVCQSSGGTFQFQVSQREIQQQQQLGSIDLTLLHLTGRAAAEDGDRLSRQEKRKELVHNTSVTEREKSISSSSHLHVSVYLYQLKIIIIITKTLNILDGNISMTSQLSHKTTGLGTHRGT